MTLGEFSDDTGLEVDVDVEIEGDDDSNEIDFPCAISLAMIGIWLESIRPKLGWALCNCGTVLKNKDRLID